MNEPPVDTESQEGGPPYAGDGVYLRNKQTGEIYPWTERMAERGDLLEALDELPKDADHDPLGGLAFLNQSPEKILPNGPSRAT